MPDQNSEELLTLTEVSKRTNISMPTLQRYKKLFQDRIPSVGEGRKQRYPEEALPIFKQIKKENIKKRGRPKKKASEKKESGAKKAASGGGKKAAAAKGGDELMTLAEIGRITGISYPTLLRYVKAHLDDIPHVGEGRKRRYKPEAVEVFEKLRSRSGRSRAKGTGRAAAGDPRVAARITELEKAQRDMGRKLDSILAKLDKPIKVTLQR